MKSHTAYLTFNTKKRTEIIPITNDVERIIRESGVQEGLALVSAMHLTASVIIQDEESGLHRDIIEWAERSLPKMRRSGIVYYSSVTSCLELLATSFAKINGKTT